MTLSNKELSRRYRQKKKLIQTGKDIFAKWQTLKSPTSTRAPKEVKHAIDAITSLPSKWTQEDYSRAHDNLLKFKNDLFFNNIANLQANIDQGRKYDTHDSRFRKGGVATADAERARNAMEIAYGIMVDTLFLANKTENDCAAAAIEVCRHVARMLMNQDTIPESDATTLCLAMLPPTFVKPSWVIPHLAKILKQNFYHTEALINELEKTLQISTY